MNLIFLVYTKGKENNSNKSIINFDGITTAVIFMLK